MNHVLVSYGVHENVLLDINIMVIILSGLINAYLCNRNDTRNETSRDKINLAHGILNPKLKSNKAKNNQIVNQDDKDLFITDRDSNCIVTFIDGYINGINEIK